MTARAALRQYRRCEELRVVYSINLKAFFSHMHHKTASHSGNSIYLCDGDNALSDQEAADTLLRTLSCNFSSSVPSPPRLDKHTPPTSPAVSLSHFNSHQVWSLKHYFNAQILTLVQTAFFSSFLRPSEISLSFY